VAAIALGFGLGIVASIFVDVVARAQGSSLSHPTPAVSLIGDLLFDVAFVAAAIYMARMATGPSGPGGARRLRAADFGFRRVSVPVAVGAVVVAAIGYYVITAVYAALFHLHGNEKLPSELGVSKSTPALVGAAVFVSVVAPVAEEFFFRGFIFGVLRRWRVMVAGRDIGTWLAAVVTGILFGLAHTGSANARYLVPLGFLGFVLCLVRWRTGSLYPCMALHSLNNSLALGVAQLHWNAVEIIGLIAGSLGVILLLTGPLSRAPRADPAAVV
jgi:membrane protease YdiL (CAAX protease family)